MATRYVSPYGSDSNTGAAADSAHAWKTIGKALGASGIVSGDTVYICPGTYREVVTVNMTSATVTTNVIGDVQNASGFTDGSAVLVPGDEVVWTAFTTSDTAAPASSPCLSPNGKNFIAVSWITFIGGNVSASCVNENDATTAGHDWSFTDCVMIGYKGSTVVRFDGRSGGPSNVTFDRCILHSIGGASCINTQSSSAASNFVVQNCVLYGSASSNVMDFTVQSGTPSGGLVLNCTIIGGGNGIYAHSGWSTVTPVQVRNCLFLSGTAAMAADVSGALVEDYNVLIGGTRSSVATGTHSTSTAAALLEIGQSLKRGAMPRPHLSPSAGSPLLGIGTDGTYSVAVDALNRPRPAGGASAVNAAGAYERHDTQSAGGAAAADGAAGNCWKVGPGPADCDIQIPVDATSTTISIKYNSVSYNGTNYPQIQLIANNEIGVAAQTVTDSSAATSYATLTLAAFTPTARGVVTLRVLNRTGDGIGITYWDTISIS